MQGREGSTNCGAGTCVVHPDKQQYWPDRDPCACPIGIHQRGGCIKSHLYKAVTTGQTLKSAEIKWYSIDDAGQEKEYFITQLDNVKVVKVVPLMRGMSARRRSKCGRRFNPSAIFSFFV